MSAPRAHDRGGGRALDRAGNPARPTGTARKGNQPCPTSSPPPTSRRARVRPSGNGSATWSVDLRRWGCALIASVSAFAGSASSSSTPAPAPPPRPGVPAPAPTHGRAPRRRPRPRPPATEAQQQALDSASSYLDTATGFSKTRADRPALQLRWRRVRATPMPCGRSSSRRELEAAGRDLGQGLPSRRPPDSAGPGLIDQLSSSAGEGFTLAQATYAADQVGL